VSPVKYELGFYIPEDAILLMRKVCEQRELGFDQFSFLPIFLGHIRCIANVCVQISYYNLIIPAVVPLNAVKSNAANGLTK
jgi:hypothetical protein